MITSRDPHTATSKLSPLSNPSMANKFQASLTGEEAKPDIRARGFWRQGQNAFFDIRVTNTNCSSQASMSTEKIYKKHEAEKKRNYNQRIMQIEHGTFTPLVYCP